MTENAKTSKLLWYAAGGVLIAAAIFFSFFGITRSLRHDECCSVEISNTTFSGIIENLKVNAHTPPLYYFLLSYWMKLFGTSEAAVRSLSAVFYLLCIIAVYHLGKILYDRKTGLLCAFLYMVSPLIIQHAQDARMYTLLPLLGILSTFYFFRLFFQFSVSRLDFALYVLINILGTFTHYWFFFVLAAQGAAVLFLAFRTAFKKFLLAGVLSLLPFLALWTSVFLEQLSNGGTSWMQKPGPGVLAATLLIFYGGGKQGILVYAAFIALILLDIQNRKAGLHGLGTVAGFLKQKSILALLILTAVSLLAPFLISQVVPIYVENRYTVIALFPWVMVIGAALARLGNQKLVLAVCLVLISAASFAFVKRRKNPDPVNFRSITEFWLKNSADKDLLIFSASTSAPVDYYLKQLEPRKSFSTISFPSEMTSHPCWTDVPKMLAGKNRLQRDIDSLLGAAERSGGETWLIKGGHAKLDSIVEKALDARLTRLGEMELGRAYSVFQKIIAVYRRPIPNPETGKP